MKDIRDIEKEIKKIKTFILQDDGSKLEGHLKKIKKTKESLNRWNSFLNLPKDSMVK